MRHLEKKPGLSVLATGGASSTPGPGGAVWPGAAGAWLWLERAAIIQEWKTIKNFLLQPYWVAFLLHQHWQRPCMSNTAVLWIWKIFNVPTPAAAWCTGFVIDQTSNTWLCCSIVRITNIAICPMLLCGNGWEHLRRASSTVQMLRVDMTADLVE